ncbi:MAG: CHASE domain-containing protein [Proteobacteria bacterium]|nr:CHASE domain-containing protein [Pseudomonadota bacterium]
MLRYLQPTIVIPTLTALILSTVAGGIAWQRIETGHREALQRAFNAETGEITLKIDERFKAYRQVLRGARALFAASREVTRQEWGQYVDALRLSEDYPGIQGVGLAVPLRAADMARHERAMRAQGFTDYHLNPPGRRNEYTAIIYLEPFDWRNQRALGFDMYSEPVRREAMARSRQLGIPALSGKVRLVQETATDTQAGVLLYLPVFRPDAALATPAQREAAFMGWIYSPFRMNDLISSAVGDATSRVRLRIYDGHDTTPANLLFDNHPSRPENGPVSSRSVLELDSRVWTLLFDSASGEDLAPPALRLEQATIVLIGALFVLLTASFCATRQRAGELVRISASLRRSEARYSTLVNLSEDGIAALDANLCFTYLNPRLIKLLGFPENELLGRRVDSLWPTKDASRSQTLTERLRHGEATVHEEQLRNADGRLITVIVTLAPHVDETGALQGGILTITDISERKASEERIRYLATHDPLTGLANRTMFMEQMNNSLLIAHRHRTRFALLFLDLDHFKEVNDSLGHAAGDALLQETARRMRHCLRASDLLARQGGDEFLALLHDIHGMDEAFAVADKIRRSISAPFELDGRSCSVSVSIGIALYPDHGQDLETLTRNADAAMYRSKLGGRDGTTVSADTP